MNDARLYQSTDKVRLGLKLMPDWKMIVFFSKMVANGSTVFAGTEGNGIFRSTDSGESWVQIKSGLPAGADISCLAVYGKYVFASFYDHGIYSSTDNGDNWVSNTAGLIGTPSADCFAITDKYVYAGVDNCGIFVQKYGKTAIIGKVATDNDNVLLMPNPVKDELNINLSEFSGVIKDISVFDAQGNKLESINPEVMQNATLLKLNITSYSPGMYYLTVETVNDKITKCFTVIR